MQERLCGDCCGGLTFSQVLGKNRVMRLLTAAIISSTCIVIGSAAEPIQLHPDNPRYFQWRGKPTILITSGEHYGAVLNLDFDYVAYLETLAADGLNHTRTFSGVYREAPSSFGITDNTLAPALERYIGPWARAGEKFDLTKWDDAYFARLKDFMAQAAKRNIVVELNFFCPFYEEILWTINPMNARNNINGIGNCKREEVYALKHDDLTEIQLALVRKTVTELRDFDNLYYEVCNEPYFGGVTMDWQRRVVDEIVAAEREFPAKHLISLNIANGRAKIEKPHPAVSIFNFHYTHPPDVIAMNSHIRKVIGENETGFRGKDDVLYRTEAWDFILAGGALYNNLDYSFTAKHPRGDFLAYKSPGGGSLALRKQLRILKNYIESFDFIRMKPSNSVIQGGTVSADLFGKPARAEVTTRVLVEEGKQYAIYVKGGTSVILTLALPEGRYRVEWINPRTGNLDTTEYIETTGAPAAIHSPAYTEDIAVRILRR